MRPPCRAWTRVRRRPPLCAQRDVIITQKCRPQVRTAVHECAYRMLTALCALPRPSPRRGGWRRRGPGGSAAAPRVAGEAAAGRGAGAEGGVGDGGVAAGARQGARAQPGCVGLCLGAPWRQRTRGDARAAQVLSGRAAQLEATARSLEQDLGFVKDELARLQRSPRATAHLAGDEARACPTRVPTLAWQSPRWRCAHRCSPARPLTACPASSPPPPLHRP
jgi:hypothetical protein